MYMLWGPVNDLCCHQPLPFYSGSTVTHLVSQHTIGVAFCMPCVSWLCDMLANAQDAQEYLKMGMR